MIIYQKLTKYDTYRLLYLAINIIIYYLFKRDREHDFSYWSIYLEVFPYHQFYRINFNRSCKVRTILLYTTKTKKPIRKIVGLHFGLKLIYYSKKCTTRDTGVIIELPRNVGTYHVYVGVQNVSSR